MKTTFTLSGYKKLIHGFIDKGYETRSFHDYSPAKPHLILRHDIDQSISVARTLADLETELGWNSTWFVLVRTEMYNPFSRHCTRHLKAMIAAGHEIGLHLDATYYDDEKSLNEGAATECRMLEDMLGTEIRVVSFHRPAKSLIGKDDLIAGRKHTYMSNYVNGIGYSSDSRGEWRYGHPWDHESVANRTALQLLTHAVWWVGHENRDKRGRLEDLVSKKIRDYEAELSSNNDVWRDA